MREGGVGGGSERERIPSKSLYMPQLYTLFVRYTSIKLERKKYILSRWMDGWYLLPFFIPTLLPTLHLVITASHDSTLAVGGPERHTPCPYLIMWRALHLWGPSRSSIQGRVTVVRPGLTTTIHLSLVIPIKKVISLYKYSLPLCRYII